jgi:hypothetical protein
MIVVLHDIKNYLPLRQLHGSQIENNVSCRAIEIARSRCLLLTHFLCFFYYSCRKPKLGFTIST